jgi:NADPH-dependent glutamate synthase beta subunit-like oxidoreductase
MSQEDAPAEGQTPDATPESKEGQEPTSKTFDAAYVQQLRAENARHRKEAQEARAKAEELEARDQSEVEKLTTQKTKLERERDDAKSALLRYEVAAEKQIPPDAVDLLVGNTREELEAKADKILTFAKQSAPTPEFDGGAREPAPEPTTPEQAHNELAVQLFGGIKPNN